MSSFTKCLHLKNDKRNFNNRTTVEPHSSEPRFNQTPRLFKLFANPPEFRILFQKKLL